MELGRVGGKKPSPEEPGLFKMDSSELRCLLHSAACTKPTFLQPLSLSKFNKIVQARKGSVIPMVYQNKQGARKMLKTG